MLTRKTWVEALRSEKYQQTTKVLRNEKGYCCLGVACDLENTDYWRLDPRGFYVFVIPNDVISTQSYSILPQSLRDKLNISYEIHANLTSMNDYGKSFEEIATYIEGLNDVDSSNVD